MISVFLRKTSMGMARGAARLGHQLISIVNLPASRRFTLKTIQSTFAKPLLRSFLFANVAFSPNKFAKMCSLMQALLAHFMQICLALNSYHICILVHFPSRYRIAANVKRHIWSAKTPIQIPIIPNPIIKPKK